MLEYGRIPMKAELAPKLWNDLPLFIRNISSVNAFKKALKTHLFQKAFPS